jgi:hypothetical protein
MAMNMNAMLKIRADVDGQNKIVALNRGLTSLGTTAAGVTGAMRGLTGASAGLSGALGTLAPLLSVAGLAGMVKGTIEAGDAMYDMAQRTGVSVEALARFKKAAATSGTDLDAVAKGLVKLSKNMVDAAAGGKESAATFAALGIDVKKADGSLKAADEVLLEVADRFKQMPDGAAKTALALRLVGKSGAELIPLLNQGSKAIEQLSVKMTTAFAEKADQYSDKLARLGGKIGALGADLTIALLPALESITDALTTAVTAFSALPSPLQNAAIGAATLALAWGPLSSVLKGSLGLVASVANGIEILRYQTALAGGVIPLLIGGLQGLRVAILAIPGWGWVLAGVTALGLLGKALYDNNATFKAWADNIGTVIANDFQAAIKDAGSYLQGLGKYSKQIGDYIANVFKVTSKDVGQSGKQTSGMWSSAFQTIAQNARGMMQAIGIAIQKLWQAIPEPLRNLLGGQAKGTGLGGLFSIGNYVQSASRRAVQMGSQQTVNRAGKGDREPPPLTPFTPDLSTLGGGSGAQGANEAKQALDSYKNALQSAGDLLRDVNRQTQDLRLETQGLGKTGVAAIEQGYAKSAVEAGRAVEDLRQKIQAIGKLRDEAAAKGLDTTALDARLTRLVNQLRALEQAQKDLRDASRLDALKGLLPSLEDYNKRIAEQTILNENRKRGLQQLTEAQKLQLAVQQAGLDKLALTNPALAEYIAKLQQAAAAVDALNKTNATSFGDQFKQKLSDAIKEADKLGEAIGGIAVDAIGGLTNKFVELAETGKAAFGDLAKEVLRSLAQIALRAAAFQFIGALFPGLKLAANGMVAEKGVQAFAQGGVVTRPTFFKFASGGTMNNGVMGEAGPEAIMPLKRGPDGKLGVAGGGGSTNITVNVDAKGTSAQGDEGRSGQLARVVAQAVQAELIKQKRPGGLMAA